MEPLTMSTIPLDQLAELVADKLFARMLERELAEDDYKLINAKEVCALLKITPPTLDARCAEGKITKLRSGGKVLYRKSEVIASLETTKPYKQKQ